MSVFGTNNLMEVFVAKEVAPATYANVTSDLQATLNQGQIAVVGFYAGPGGGYEEKLGAAGHTVSAANYPYIRFVKETASGDLLYGSKIYGKDLIAVSSAGGVAPSEQNYCLGYNGQTGSLDVSQANDFILTIAYDHDDMMWSEQKLRNAYDYYSTAPTQQNLAVSMATQINYKENLGKLNGTGRMVKAQMFNSGTAAAVQGAVTASVKNLSDIVTFSGASTDNAVGTILRLGFGASATDPDTGASLNSGTASGRGTAVPVYVITEANNTASPVGALPGYSCRINMVFQGPTTATLAAANMGTVTAGANWGVMISGLPLTWRKDFFKFLKVKYHFDLKGFGASTLTKTGSSTDSTVTWTFGESTKGKGFWQEVSEYESFSAGFQGALNRTVVPLPIGLIETPTTTPSFSGAGTGLGANYNMWYIESKDSQNNSPIVATPGMRIQTFIFFPDGTQGDAQQADLVNNSNWNVDAWFSAYGFTLTTV